MEEHSDRMLMLLGATPEGKKELGREALRRPEYSETTPFVGSALGLAWLNLRPNAVFWRQLISSLRRGICVVARLAPRILHES